MRSMPLLVALSFAFLSLPAPGRAQSYDWASLVDGQWSNASNWSPVGVPAAPGASASFGAQPVTVTVDVDPTIDFLTATSPYTLVLSAGRVLTVLGPSQVAAGSLLLTDASWLGPGPTTSGARHELSGSTALENFTLLGDSDLLGRWSTGHALLTLRGVCVNQGDMHLWMSGGAYQAKILVEPAAAFTNRGTIYLDGGAPALQALRGPFVNEGTFTVGLGGSLELGPVTNRGTIGIAAGASLEVPASVAFLQESGTLDCGGIYLQTGGSFTFAGGATIGRPLLAGSALDFGGASTANGTIVLGGQGGSLGGTVPASATVEIHGSWLTSGHGQVGTAGDPGNDGTIRWTTSGSGTYESTLSVAGGHQVVNRGTMEFASGGRRHLAGHVVNEGLFLASFEGEILAAPFVNRGTLQVASGVQLDLPAGADFRQEAGSLEPAGIFLLDSGSFEWSGGVSSGPPFLKSSALSLPSGSTATGALALTGAGGTITGDLQLGQDLSILGTVDQGGDAQVLAAAGLVNRGTLRLSDTHGGYGARLDVSGGVLRNEGTLRIEAGGGGGRHLAAILDNAGTCDIETNATLGVAGAAHVNRGVLSLREPAALTTASGSSFTNVAGGRLEGVGRLDLGGMVLANEGRIAPGLAGPGRLDFTGALVCAGGSSLELELGGPIAGVDTDLLAVSGPVTLDGILELELRPGFLPQLGDRFTILTSGGLTGAFQRVQATGFPFGLRPRVVRNGSTIEIECVAPPPAGAAVKELLLAAPAPGHAGQSNDFAVTQAAPGSEVRLYAGLQPGATPVPGCGGVVFEFLAPQLGGAATADPRGRAVIAVPVPAQLAGQTVLFQALEPSNCRISALLAFTFP